MKYVLINPVVDSMYERDKLDFLLLENGYSRVECEVSWGPVVKEKYKQVIETGEGTVVDVRCPVAAQKVKERYNKEGLLIPEIEPILLHCAREISERAGLEEYEKVITTPCKALADSGNMLGLKKTIFMAWNEFEAMLNKRLVSKSLEASPIPPGFFSDLDTESDSISGKDKIEQYFKEEAWREKGIVEILYCEQGCHNGDGVCDYA